MIVYILYSPLVDRYFVGKTSNLEKSLERHNRGKNKHTKTGLPWNLMYKESFESAGEAREKEVAIKSSANREQLTGFIKSENNELNLE
ncbi:MAG TPA: GIY-YIG nuclease family protein [Balneolaceae bacterium]|nr:GIY-YIG nuclease family protein [Balneolaceae bacterium]